MLNRDVIIIGAGISGLTTADQLSKAGFSVAVFSKGADPRCRDQRHPSYNSSTWDGYVNRYITITEGHSYMSTPGYTTIMYPDIAEDFRLHISEGGFLAKSYAEFDATTQAFLDARGKLQQDIAGNIAIHKEYISENRASMALWYQEMADVLKADSTMQQKLSLSLNGIDRFYYSEELFYKAAEAHKKEGVLKATYRPEEIKTNPHLAIYKNNTFVRGGGLTAYGLAFNIHAYCREVLLKRLAAQGVQFYWGSEGEVSEIIKPSGVVTAIKTAEGKFYTAKYYCMAGGAYLNQGLLKNTDAYGKISGVKGLWLRIKNCDKLLGLPPPRANKVHGRKRMISVKGREYPSQVIDLNIMPMVHENGSWDLIIGSGYVFLGCNPESYGDTSFADYCALKAAADVVSELYNIPVNLDAAIAGQVENQIKNIDIPSAGCIRSWSVDDRELRELIPTALGGYMLIEGGGNTGSTTKSLFLAKVTAQFFGACEGGRDIAPAEYDKIRAASAKSVHEVCWEDLEREILPSRRQLSA